VNESLTMIVPVRNGERALAPLLERLLELLPDLTSRFDILVVDDGSIDHTEEIARDWARRYPQVGFVRHPQPLGWDEAIKRGLAAARGQTLVVLESADPPSAADLRRLWALRHDRDVVLARAEARPAALDPVLLQRLVAWGRSLGQLGRRAGSGVQLIRRDAAAALGKPAADSDGLRIFHLPSANHDMAHQARADQPHPRPLPPPRRRSALLKHLRDLALGE
jgi:glycosyltransferase involved in cell wall biosynthesis